jgi:hypothetical protein
MIDNAASLLDLAAPSWLDTAASPGATPPEHTTLAIALAEIQPMVADGGFQGETPIGDGGGPTESEKRITEIFINGLLMN